MPGSRWRDRSRLERVVARIPDAVEPFRLVLLPRLAQPGFLSSPQPLDKQQRLVRRLPEQLQNHPGNPQERPHAAPNPGPAPASAASRWEMCLNSKSIWSTLSNRVFVKDTRRFHLFHFVRMDGMDGMDGRGGEEWEICGFLLCRIL